MEPTNNENNGQVKKSHKGLGIGIAAVGLVAVAAIAVFAGKKNTDDQNIAPDATTNSADTTAVTPVTQTDTTSSTTDTYKDGTYTATGSYVSPGGADQIGVTVTLKDDVITDASVTPMPGDNTSAHYQGIFAANYKPLVVGKKISDVQLSKVSGSSLTSAGFNAALAKIETQAQA